MYKKLILYFNRYPLYLEGESSYRFHIPEDSAKQETFNYKVKLPDGVTCSQCVIQWIYFTGNKLLIRKFNPFIMIHLGLIIYKKKATLGINAQTERNLLVVENRNRFVTAPISPSLPIRRALVRAV